MTRARKLLVLPGDGVGPEVIGASTRVLEWFQVRGAALAVEIEPVGAASVAACGTALSDEVFAKAQAADAILVGAVGGPEHEHLPPEQRPESALLRLRSELGLYGNLRPVRWRAALAESSPLKADRARGADLIIVRELNGGVYFGAPRGIEGEPGGRRGFDTQSYAEAEIVRIARMAFEIARTRSRRLGSVDKCNVMNSGRLWRDVVSALATDYPDVELAHFYADNCAYQLVRNPTQFDVLLMDNLFGDVLSDVAAAIAGSLGLLPSASLGERRGKGWPGLYEPVHGTAPDIAGRGLANPVGAILSLAMAMRHSLDLAIQAGWLEHAVDAVLGAGVRTADVAGPGATPVSTGGFADAVIEALERRHG